MLWGKRKKDTIEEAGKNQEQLRVNNGLVKKL